MDLEKEKEKEKEKRNKIKKRKKPDLLMDDRLSNNSIWVNFNDIT